MTKKIEYNGKEYNSYKELANEIGCSKNLISKYTKNDELYKLNDYKPTKSYKSIYFNGKEYNSVIELANEIGCNKKYIYKLIKNDELYKLKNYSPRNIKVNYQNRTFNSYKDFCDFYNLDYSKFINYKEKYPDLSLEELIDDFFNKRTDIDTSKSNYNRKIISIFGNEYNTYKELCRSLNLDYYTFLSRKFLGYDLKTASYPFKLKDRTMELNIERSNKYFNDIDDMIINTSFFDKDGNPIPHINKDGYERSLLAREGLLEITPVDNNNNITKSDVIKPESTIKETKKIDMNEFNEINRKIKSKTFVSKLIASFRNIFK